MVAVNVLREQVQWEIFFNNILNEGKKDKSFFQWKIRSVLVELNEKHNTILAVLFFPFSFLFCSFFFLFSFFFVFWRKELHKRCSCNTTVSNWNFFPTLTWVNVNVNPLTINPRQLKRFVNDSFDYFSILTLLDSIPL